MIGSLSSKTPSFGIMNINGYGVGSVGSMGSGLTIGASSAESPEAAAKKASIYDNFQQEMNRRIAETQSMGGKKESEAEESTMLGRSLAGAMGEIEKIFGKEAATETMVQILHGTSEELTESSLVSSIQNALAGLAKSDPNGTKMKQLTDGFNKDLQLVFNKDKEDETAESQATFSLSYAISKHFGTLMDPEDYESRKETRNTAVKSEQDAPLSDMALLEKELMGRFEESGMEAPFVSMDGGNADFVPAGDGNGVEKSSSKPLGANPQVELVEMTGFDAEGKWGTVEIAKPDAIEDEELKEKASQSISEANNLNMSVVINSELTGGEELGKKLVEDLAKYLREDLQDEESAVFLEEAMKEAMEAAEKKYGGSNSSFTDQISQIYSKIAAEMDDGKRKNLENYLNKDFKDGLNEIIGHLQNGSTLPLADDVGMIEFKGVTGLSDGMETDDFSLNWGYAETNAMDKSFHKKVMREDHQPIKRAVDQKNSKNERNLELAREQSRQEEKLREEGYYVPTAPSYGPKTASSAAAPGYSHIRNDFNENRKVWDDLEAQTGVEKTQEEVQQEKLAEAMGLKAGQLDDATLDKIKEFLADRFDEENVEEMMGELKWNDDLMTGLASIHRTVRETGKEGESDQFVDFLNSDVKKNVQNLTEKIQGIGFEGFTATGGLTGDLSAQFKFSGEEELMDVNIVAPSRESLDKKLAEGSSPEQILGLTAKAEENDPKAKNAFKKQQRTGILVKVTA